MEGKLTKPHVYKYGYEAWAVDVPSVDPDINSLWWADGKTHEEALDHLAEYYDYQRKAAPGDENH